MPTNPTSKPYLPETFKAQFNAPMPDILYHYTGQNGLIGIAKDAVLWATKIQSMNDATEFGLALGIARNELENIVNSSHHPGADTRLIRPAKWHSEAGVCCPQRLAR